MLSRALALFVCFVAAAGLIARAQQNEVVPQRAPFSEFPMSIGEWRGVQEPPFDATILELLRVDDYLTRAYFTPERSGVGLYIGYWGSQRQGEAIHSPLNCLPGAGWQPVSKSLLNVQVAQGSPSDRPVEIGVNRYVVQKGLDRQLVLYWYQSHGRVVASEYWSKFYLIGDAVRLHRSDAALVRVIAPVAQEDASEAAADAVGVRFVKALFPVLSSYLPT